MIENLCVRQQGLRVIDRLHQDHVHSELQLPAGGQDHQGSLNRILNKAAADIIDISVMDQTPGLLEHQDILERSSIYNKRLATGLISIISFTVAVFYYILVGVQIAAKYTKWKSEDTSGLQSSIYIIY